MDGFNDDDVARSVCHTVDSSRIRPKLTRTSNSAIALSLQDAAGSAQHQKPVEVIEIDSDDDDVVGEDAQFQAELRRVMELSKSDTGPSTAASSRTSSILPAPTPVTPMSHEANNPLLFDRKRLEEERLARQKRLRPEMHQSSINASEEEEDEDTDDNASGRDSKRQRLSSTLSSAHRANASSSSIPPANAHTTESRGDSFFWEGELRQTANRLVDPDKDTRPVFRLSEILGPVSIDSSTGRTQLILSFVRAEGRYHLCDIIRICYGSKLDIRVF